MPASTVLVIATLAAETAAPATSAAATAVQASLGPSVEVRVEANTALGEAPKPPDLEGFVSLTWDSPEHGRARLLCYVPVERRWVDREIGFRAEDPELERGRALGFVIASIYVDEHPPPSDVAPIPPPSLPPKPRVTHYAVGAAAALTVPDDSTTFGAWLGFERRVARRAFVGLFAEARFGSVPSAQATTRFLGAGATGELEAFRLGSDASIGFRLSLSVVDVAVSHLSSDDRSPDTQQRVLPGADLTLQGRYLLTPASSLWVGVGASAVAGTTDIVVHGQVHATLPAVVGLARLGLQTEF